MTEMMQTDVPMIPKSFLKSERFWTDALIRDHLPEPCKTKPNPHYRTGPPMQLYQIDRIEEMEQIEVVARKLQIIKERRPERSKIGKDIAQAKRQELITAITQLNIEITRCKYEHVVKAAIDHFNYRASLYADRASKDSDPEFLNRITGNFIRHCLTDYDSILSQLHGRIGRHEVYFLLKDRVMEKIHEIYPELASAN